MQNQAFENMEKAGEVGLETAKRLGGWNSRLWDRLTEHQLAGVALWMDAGIKQLRLLGESHSPYDLYAGQTQLAQEYAERVSEYLRQTLTMMAEVQNGLGGVFRPEVKELGVAPPRPQASEAAAPPGPDKPRIADRPQHPQ